MHAILIVDRRRVIGAVLPDRIVNATHGRRLAVGLGIVGVLTAGVGVIRDRFGRRGIVRFVTGPRPDAPTDRTDDGDHEHGADDANDLHLALVLFVLFLSFGPAAFDSLRPELLLFGFGRCARFLCGAGRCFWGC